MESFCFSLSSREICRESGEGMPHSSKLVSSGKEKNPKGVREILTKIQSNESPDLNCLAFGRFSVGIQLFGVENI